MTDDHENPALEGALAPQETIDPPEVRRVVPTDRRPSCPICGREPVAMAGPAPEGLEPLPPRLRFVASVSCWSEVHVLQVSGHGATPEAASGHAAARWRAVAGPPIRSRE